MDDHNIIEFKKPEENFEDSLTKLLRVGAQNMLKSAVETELEEFLSHYRHFKDERGYQQVVRNGYHPERDIQTGIGSVAVQVPRVRDRSKSGIKFTSSLLPPYLRRTKSMEELIPWLYLKGISTGDFGDAFEGLLGPQAKGFSAKTVSRLKEAWTQEHIAWEKRDLSKKRYVYFWVDGIYLKARMEERQCILVIMGADETGKKELIALQDGFREDELSWTEVLLDLKNRGLKKGPVLSTGDGSLGFWNAMAKIYPETERQRCWVHKTVNILSKMPKSLHSRAKQNIHNIWMAESRKEAEKAFQHFIRLYEAKYPKAAECLAKDKEALLTFYDYPAEHWAHIRTTNPIESTFATVRLRTVKTRGCLSRKTGKAMVFKLVQSAEKKWLRLRGYRRVAEIIRGVNFKDGIAVKEIKELRNAA